MNATMSYHCSSSPMEERKTENLWSECFQDLGSWCHPPQDELNTPIITNQNEFNFGFDDQSMYYHWEANTSSIDLKSEMWKPPADMLPLQFATEEDNNNSLMQTIPNKNNKETGIRYSGNLFLTQCPLPDIDQDADQADTKSIIKWDESIVKQGSTDAPQPDVPTRRDDIIKNPPKAVSNKPKSSLKLNIAAAKATAPSDIPPYSMNTPDVFKSLSEESGFSLISFVCDGYDENLLSVDPASISQRPKDSPEQIIKIDHDYAETLPDEDSFLCHKVEAVKKEDDILKTIDEEEEDLKPFPLAVKEEPSSPSPSTSTSVGKRVRKSLADEDFIYDDEAPSDQSSDWSPSSKKRMKSGRKKSGDSRQSKRSRTSSVSDSGSVTSGPDRYRELRDRNNEASRRSRMNRKQREVEMMERSTSLEKENLQLKVRAENLEKRVKTLREILLKVVLAKNKSNN